MDFRIIDLSLHHINFQMGIIDRMSLQKGSAESYIKRIIDQSINNKDVRYFKITSDTTEVISLINKMINHIKKESINDKENSDLDSVEEIAATNEESDIFDKISYRLCREEKKSQEENKNLKNEIKKGSLIQAMIEIDSKIAYVLAKVEHLDYLDKNDLEVHTGLPIEKIILKTCIITYDKDFEIEDIKIYDSNSTISKYWRDGFLDLVEASSNEDNTLKSFKAIERILSRNIKGKSKADYSLLHNSLLSYYEQNKNFEYNDLVNKVFKNYTPVEDDVIDINNIMPKLNDLPKKNNFDAKFDIINDVIRSKKKRVININSNIDLTIKNSIDNLRGMITGIKEPNEEYYIKIKVDEAVYSNFNFKE
ncbi:hypothetical protein [Clostridium botulinum]|uniref:hypothetical protein n=1 Tax=Clostridium botulinum TaxID=1491 RepID=UPI001C9AB62A|nr:hypothetical protein [Clostridium botulinum]MBY6898087.1 hypothetical protein [Clostridium botulinum]MBY6913286.1 hypothetical protein [Clostridium botulinum]